MTKLVLALAVAASLGVAPLWAQGISRGGDVAVAAAPGVAPAVPEVPPAGPRGLLASDPLAVQAAMLAEGFQAKLTASSNGDPMITGKISRTSYWVYFLDCNDAVNCRGVQFHSAYRLNRQVDAAEMDDFNSQYRYVRASLDDDGNPRMQMELLLRDEGMGPMTFATYLDLWRKLIGHWETHLGV